LGLGHVAIILFAISVSMISIPVYAASNIVILEVEPNPAGTDAGNEWVRLFNPSGSSVNLSGWKISSTHGNTNTYFLSEIIPACDDIKIIFSSQFIDNEDESLILYDNTGKVVDSTPIIYDTENDATTWKIPTPSCESIESEVEYHTGVVSWDLSSYENGDTGYITIEDPDLNEDSNLIELAYVQVTSDSDLSGVEVLLVESGSSTGVFSGDIIFASTTNDFQIRVTGGDQVYVEYEDTTMPSGGKLIVGDAASIRYQEIPIPSPPPSSTDVVIPAGTSVPGCEESDACFLPSVFVIDEGETVTWYNADSAAHTVTSGSAAEGPDGYFDSSLFMAGTSFSVNFNGYSPGEYVYHCMVHPWMIGTVIVQGTSTPTPTGPPITVSTDRSSYKNGDIIRVSGNVNELLSGYQVALQVFEPRFGNQVAIQKFSVGPDKKYHTEVTAGGGLWRSDGTYTIKVLYGSEDRTAKTTFEFSGSGIPLPEPTPSPTPKPALTVKTNKSNYNEGDAIIISGQVKPIGVSDKVTVQIFHGGNLIEIAQVILAYNGQFSHTVLSEGPLWQNDGRYTIRASYGTQLAETSFEFNARDDAPPPPKPEPQPTPTPSPSSVEVRNAPGSSVPGCEETNECFIPGVVNIAIGGTVTWVNDDTAAHTSTSGSAADGPDGNWDSSLVMVGQSFSHTFDEAGDYPYFCMVHPWMTGMVIVGEGGPIPPPPTPSPRISISVNADQAVYDLGDIVNLRVKISGTTSAQNVGVSVTDPTGKAVVSRTLETDRNGNADFDFGIHEDFKTGTYRVAVTSSIGGVTYKDATHFKIQSQFNQIRIVSVEGTDQQGNPAPFTRDQMGFVKVVVNANKPITSLITVNLFDSELTTIGIASFRTTLSTGETEVILSFMIPDDAATGAADIFTNAFSDWPSNGGVPLTGEFSANVRIT